MINRILKFKKINLPLLSGKTKTKNPINNRNNFKAERRYKLNQIKFTKKTGKVTSLLLLIFTLTITQFISGCGDSDIAGINSSSTNTISGAGQQSPSEIQPEANNILLSMTLSFRKNIISSSKLLESNSGYRFQNIVSVERNLKPGEEIDLQELQPYGIFSLYLSGTGSFALTNSDGMNLGTKTILLEKCSFIDLKLVNTEQKEIQVSGYVAGE